MMAKKTAVVPNHLGIILDGNRRWAKAQGIPQLEGHRRGYEKLKEIGQACAERGIKYVSAYVFSTENWNRTKTEVDYLMKLLLWVAKSEVNELHKHNIRVRFLGSRDKLSQKIIDAIEAAEAKTKDNTNGTLCLCLNYGGQQEIVDAVKHIVASGTVPNGVTKELIEANLYAADVPPIDFIIRTSGEQRLSNFMMWRSAYSELYFPPMHWPAFTIKDLDKALAEFARRQRRYGV